MPKQRNEETGWKPCPEGEIRRMVGGIKRRRQARVVAQVASAALLLCLGGFALVSVSSHGGGIGTSGLQAITCDEVRSHAQAYVSGSIDQALRNRIEAHLKECASCQALIREMSHSKTSQVNARVFRYVSLHASPSPRNGLSGQHRVMTTERKIVNL